jgi:hypothetical protein
MIGTAPGNPDSPLTPCLLSLFALTFEVCDRDTGGLTATWRRMWGPSGKCRGINLPAEPLINRVIGLISPLRPGNFGSTDDFLGWPMLDGGPLKEYG